jgi:riboflavin kinase / FMN adenylyltransferase
MQDVPFDVILGSSSLGRELRDPAVAIGTFDGVHVGHRALIARAREAAGERGGTTVVLTFAPPPVRVLAPARAPALITTPARKWELLAEAGADACVVEPFTAELAAWSAEDFVREILVARLHARAVVVGESFTYGRDRAGTPATLAASGRALGFATHVLPPVRVGGDVVSSTRIRELIRAGKVDEAGRLLGRSVELDGVVVRGAGRGRALGMPTANVASETELIPAAGVYAGHVLLLEDPSPTPRQAVVNIGANPTFTRDGATPIEAHILDFEGHLYGRRLRVVLDSWLRAEERFPSVEALVAQVRRDIADARLKWTGALKR